MALLSPGVEVTIVDESNYLPAASNSVPYLLIATAENKVSGTSTGVAPGTLASNAGEVFLITSQRELAATFGNPFFYSTATGTPINGFELNEYGLLAAHSVLGISNRAYVQRADVDLAELTATLTRPTGAPDGGTYWLDTALTDWGIFQWNQTTGSFTVQTPIVITNTADLDSGIPAENVGSIGDYAVVATNASNPTYYKTVSNEWVLVGSDAWKNAWPTVQGTNTVAGAVLTQGDAIVINDTSVAVPAGETLTSLVGAINTAAIGGIRAEVDANNRFVLYATSDAESDGSTADGGLINIDPSSTAGLLTTLGVSEGIYLAPALQQSPNYTVPRWRNSDAEPRPTGSIWNKTTSANSGASLIVRRYDSALGAFVNIPVSIYENDQTANAEIDSIRGGLSIPTQTLYAQYNVSPESVSNGFNNTFTIKLFERAVAGATVVVGDTTTPTFTPGDTFTIQTSTANSTELTAPATATINGTGSAADFVSAVSAAGVPGVSANVTSTGQVVFTQSIGGVIVVNDVTGTPISDAGFNTSAAGVRAGTDGDLILSSWEALTYTASDVAIDQDPEDGRRWYYSAVDQVDIMIHNGTTWVGYQNVASDVRGFNLSLTNPTGPIVGASEPLTQTDNTPLVYGDLWVDTSDLEQYPILRRWQNVDGVDQWVLINNTDQTTEDGIVFADARWSASGTVDPVTGTVPSIVDLLSSNYLDLDAPSPATFPTGTLLWNTRRGGFNVKSFEVGHFNAIDFDVAGYSGIVSYAVGDKVLYNGKIYVAIQAGSANLPTDTGFWSELETNAWVSVSGNRADGSPNMGRLAVRSIVVAAMKEAIDTQATLREEQNVFNLMATPGYPELLPNMIALNNERSNTGFIVGDTPLRLSPDQNNLVEWATNDGGAGVFAGDGLSTGDPYVGVFYPACQTNDLSGNTVVQPASHMMLRAIIRSDEVSFPWLAPAGTRRGLIDNVSRIGYVDSVSGEFVTTANGQGVRDVLYQNSINPITFLPGSGIVNYGNKTLAASPSSLDRINVARLIAYVRSRLNEITKNFVFEPNDRSTRNEVSNAITGLMQDLVAKRGVFDFLVVCDESNNTPARIDRNELYVDIAIEPVKAVEFIYIPVRIKNTGELSAGDVASSNEV